jgi:hypothetical protein
MRYILDFSGVTNPEHESARGEYDSAAQAIEAAPANSRWLVLEHQVHNTILVAAAPAVLAEQPAAPEGIDAHVWALACTAYRYANQWGEGPDSAASDAAFLALDEEDDEAANTAADWIGTLVAREFDARPQVVRMGY